jgi:hypothetical protein
MNSQAEKKRKGKSRGARGGDGVYVYCLGKHEELKRPFEDQLPGGVELGPLDLIVAGDIAAVVSAVPMADYGESALRERLAEPAWVAVRAMRHEKVIEHFAARASVIPLRFGTIYLRPDRVRDMMRDRREEFIAIVERLNGKEEWGVNVCRDWEILMKTVISLSPRLDEISKRAASSGAGQSYLLRKQIDSLSAEEARRETQSVIAEVDRDLAAASEGAARLRSLNREVSEQGEVVARLAFLVSRSRFDDFREEAERLARRHGASGFRLELTGPWPAYNFSNLDDRDE